jgi:hypothetical protein
LKPEIHSILDDTISAMDALQNLQRNIHMMFLPNARFSTATQFASQVSLGGLQLSSKEVKIWDSISKEAKERDEEEKKNKQSPNFSNFKGKGSGKRQGKKYYCTYCQQDSHTVDRCRIRIKDERESRSKGDKK